MNKKANLQRIRDYVISSTIILEKHLQRHPLFSITKSAQFANEDTGNPKKVVNITYFVHLKDTVPYCEEQKELLVDFPLNRVVFQTNLTRDGEFAIFKLTHPAYTVTSHVRWSPDDSHLEELKKYAKLLGYLNNPEYYEQMKKIDE